MNRTLSTFLTLFAITLFAGCGNPGNSENDVAKSGAAPSGNPVSTAANVIPPNEVVAMFSDSIRRGDKETTIKLITMAARQEIQRRGLTIDPPGSPQSSYKIGEVRFMDQDRDAAYVESLWIEPGENGQPNVRNGSRLGRSTRTGRLAHLRSGHRHGTQSAADTGRF